jgi:hypothetical protein
MELSLKHMQNKREESHSDATKDTNEHLDISVGKNPNKWEMFLKMKVEKKEN